MKTRAIKAEATITLKRAVKVYPTPFSELRAITLPEGTQVSYEVAYTASGTPKGKVVYHHHTGETFSVGVKVATNLPASLRAS